MAALSNPLKADLDGGGYAITDLSTLVSNGSVTAGNGVLYLDNNHNRPSVRWVNEDPRTDPRAADAQPGSLAIEFSQTPALWVKTGPFPADWRRAALEP